MVSRSLSEVLQAILSTRQLQKVVADIGKTMPDYCSILVEKSPCVYIIYGRPIAMRYFDAAKSRPDPYLARGICGLWGRAGSRLEAETIVVKPRVQQLATDQFCVLCTPW